MVDTVSSLPSFAKSPSFPLEGQLRVKRLEPAVESEPPREGEDPSDCVACAASDDAYVWVSDRWRVRATEGPTGLPMVLILESRSHLALGDLPNLLAAELGVMTVRLERAMRSLDEIAQVHVHRSGDGAAHLHIWFLGRPVGQLQLRGPFLAMWDEILDPVPEAQWRINLSHIAAWLEEFGGRSKIEPPRIEWHAPSTFASMLVAELPADTVAKPANEDSTSSSVKSEAQPPSDHTSSTTEPPTDHASSTTEPATDPTEEVDAATEPKAADAPTDATDATAPSEEQSADKPDGRRGGKPEGTTTARIPAQATRARGARVGSGPRSVAASTRDHVIDHTAKNAADEGKDLDLAAESH